MTRLKVLVPQSLRGKEVSELSLSWRLQTWQF